MQFWILFALMINAHLGYEIFKKEKFPNYTDFKAILNYDRENVHPSLKIYNRIPSPNLVLKQYVELVKKRTKLRHQQIEQDKRDHIYRIYLAKHRILKDFLSMRFL